MVGKRKIALLLAGLIGAATLIGCQKSGQTTKQEEKIEIGISQLVQHPALDSAREGFIEGLKENGYEDAKTLLLIIKMHKEMQLHHKQLRKNLYLKIRI